MILLAGRVVGLWRRTLGRNAVAVEARWFDPPADGHRRTLAAAAAAYGVFLGRPVELAVAG